MTQQIAGNAGVYAAFLDAAERVLETMFFDSLCGEPLEAAPATGSAYSIVKFRGSRAGRLELTLDQGAAVTLASNFLGLDERPSETEVESTVAELANMCCGAFLSRLEPRGHFDIDPPNVQRLETPTEQGPWTMLPIEAGKLFWRLGWHATGSTAHQ